MNTTTYGAGFNNFFLSKFYKINEFLQDNFY